MRGQCRDEMKLLEHIADRATADGDQFAFGKTVHTPAVNFQRAGMLSERSEHMPLPMNFSFAIPLFHPSNIPSFP